MMAFCLCNAPSSYQRVVDEALGSASNSQAYIDDTLTYSQSFGEHLQHLRDVLVWAVDVVFLSDHNPLFWMRGQRDPRGSSQGGCQSWNHYTIELNRDEGAAIVQQTTLAGVR